MTMEMLKNKFHEDRKIVNDDLCVLKTRSVVQDNHKIQTGHYYVKRCLRTCWVVTKQEYQSTDCKGKWVEGQRKELILVI